MLPKSIGSPTSENESLKILICSHLYAPSVGGIETMSLCLAQAWRARGHAVKVVTTTLGPDEVDGIRILRNPTAWVLWRETRWSDVCFHNNISLRWAWAPFVAFRPWVITHQTWLAKADGQVAWQERMKRGLLRSARSIAISAAVEAHLPGPATVIPNAYDDTVFFMPSPAVERDQDLAFVGRFVSDKGGELLMSALQILAKNNLRPRLSMIGKGPERERWEKLAEVSGVSDQVRWVGELGGSALADELRRHRALVVPSRWAEPFGIVALEGAACGCVVVGSSYGGLKDAIGPCGETFPNGDLHAFSETLKRVLEGKFIADCALIESHLRKHRLGVIADRYLSVFVEERK
jgi:glycogen(starch) synthase